MASVHGRATASSSSSGDESGDEYTLTGWGELSDGSGSGADGESDSPQDPWHHRAPKTQRSKLSLQLKNPKPRPPAARSFSGGSLRYAPRPLGRRATSWQFVAHAPYRLRATSPERATTGTALNHAHLRSPSMSSACSFSDASDAYMDGESSDTSVESPEDLDGHASQDEVHYDSHNATHQDAAAHPLGAKEGRSHYAESTPFNRPSYRPVGDELATPKPSALFAPSEDSSASDKPCAFGHFADLCDSLRLASPGKAKLTADLLAAAVGRSSLRPSAREAYEQSVGDLVEAPCASLTKKPAYRPQVYASKRRGALPDWNADA